MKFIKLINDGLHLYNLWFVEDESVSTGEGYFVKERIN